MDSLEVLSELESDLLAELFNVGVGCAANSLSQMVNQEVLLSVPEVKFVNTEKLAGYIGKDGKICGIGQEVTGSFDAQSMLLFPEKSSMEVVRQMLGEELSDEVIAEMQQEAMNEIGNIVLNACIGSISNALGSELVVSLPTFYMDNAENVIDASMDGASDIVLFITIDMTLKESEVIGYMVFFLGPMSLQKLQNQLKTMLAGMM